MIEQPLDSTCCSSIQFFNSPHPSANSLINPLPLTQLVRLPGATYYLLSSAWVSYGTPCHSIAHQVLPTQPLPREAEDFSIIIFCIYLSILPFNSSFTNLLNSKVAPMII